MAKLGHHVPDLLEIFSGYSDLAEMTPLELNCHDLAEAHLQGDHDMFVAGVVDCDFCDNEATMRRARKVLGL